MVLKAKNTRIMKRLLLLCLLMNSCLLYSYAQEQVPQTGYIVTLSNMELTGAIGEIDHSFGGTMVEYVNDFGTPYYLHPALIRGFVYHKGVEIYAYESKYWDEHWYFLRVQYAGDNISLLQTPEYVQQIEIVEGRIEHSERKIVQYWIEFSNGYIQPLKRVGFRWQMKRLMRESAPGLARKIGRKGYRYKNLYTVLREYDEELARRKKRL